MVTLPYTPISIDDKIASQLNINRPKPIAPAVGMVAKRKPQKTRYQGVAYVIGGNSYMAARPPGSGLCVL